MKLRLEDKLKIIKLYHSGEIYSNMGEIFRDTKTTINTTIRQYRQHGLESFKERKSWTKYSADCKFDIVNQILKGRSYLSIGSELLINISIILSWVKKYQLFGYNDIINKTKGRSPMTIQKNNKPKLDKTQAKIKALEEERAKLKMELDLLKKLRALVEQRTEQENKKK